MLMSWNLFCKNSKKLNDLVSKVYIKKTVHSKLNMKVNGKKIIDVSALIQTNWYNTDNQNLEVKIGDIDKKYLALVV